MGDQWTGVAQRLSRRLCDGTIHNVIGVHLACPPSVWCDFSGPDLPVFIIQTLVIPNIFRQSLHFCFEREIWFVSGRIK